MQKPKLYFSSHLHLLHGQKENTRFPMIYDDSFHYSAVTYETAQWETKWAICSTRYSRIKSSCSHHSKSIQ